MEPPNFLLLYCDGTMNAIVKKIVGNHNQEKLIMSPWRLRTVTGDATTVDSEVTTVDSEVNVMIRILRN